MIECRPTPNYVVILIKIGQSITQDLCRAPKNGEICETFKQADDEDQMAIREFGKIMMRTDYARFVEAAF
jgi:hypothetical protein